MTDRSELERMYRRSVRTCLLIAVVPLVLVVIAFVMADPAVPGAPGSGTAGLMYLVILGVVGLSPLVTAPLIRSVGKRVASISAEGISPADAVALFSTAECAVWVIAALMGFVGFVQGAPWAYLLAGVAVSLAGMAYSFPRWSVFVETGQ